MNETSGYPKLIVGEAGAGKSSIMAKAARTALLQMDRSSQLWLATAFACPGGLLMLSCTFCCVIV